MLSSRHVSEMLSAAGFTTRRDRRGAGDAARRIQAAIVGPLERLEARLVMSAEVGGDVEVLIEPEPLTAEPVVADPALPGTTTTNTPPVAVDDEFWIDEDPAGPAVFNVLANDTDIDPGEVLEAVLIIPPENAVWAWDGAAGEMTLRPDLNFHGTIQFTYFAIDAVNASNIATVTVHVRPVNDAPVLASIPAQTGSVGGTVSFLAAATDVDLGDTLTFSLAGEPQGAIIDPATGAFSWTPTTSGDYTFDVIVTDAAGAFDTETVSIHVVSDAPQVRIVGAPASSPEGTAVALGSELIDTGQSDVHHYAWSVTKDGAPYGTGGLGTAFSFTPADNGTYLVTLQVTDGDGDVGADSVTINVTNVAPATSILGAPTSPVNEGNFLSLGSNVSDPGTDSHTYAWQVTLDDQLIAAGSDADFVFTPDDNGAYVVTLTVTDDDGAASNVATTTVTVLNVAPTASIDDGPGSGSGGSPVLTAGETIQFVGSAFDPGLGDHLTYAWSVTKDGIAFPATGSGTTFAFTPTEGGAYRISFTVSDDDQASDVDAVSVLVVDAPIAVQASSSPSALVEGGSVTVSGTASGGRVSGGYTVTIDWGDGTLPTTLSTTGGSFSASHPYTDDNAADLYAIGVTVQDTTGASAATSLSASVTNADPVVTLSDAPAGALEGGDIVMSGAVTDAGTADTLTVSWSATKNGNPFASGTGTAISFKPDDNATYVVTLTATDDDGGNATVTSTFSVGNAAPVVTLTSPVPGTNYVTGSVVNIAASFTDAGTADTHTVDLSVVTPDGVAVPVTATVDASGNVTANYTVTNRGVYEIVLTVTDDDGGTMTVRRYIAVDAAQQGSTEGFIAGGGWYYSDAGSNALSPTQTGKAHFAAVAWYEDGYDSPLGMLLFRVGTTTFRSSSFESLVVEGNKATLEGVGTLNGVAGYSFRVTVVDGSSTGSADEIRVEIRRADTGLIVYDSNMGEPEDELTTLLGGNLKVTG